MQGDDRNDQGRLIVVSNRLPLTLHQNEQGRWSATPSSGGLVSAMLPVLRNRGGLWIGWSGTTEDDVAEMRNVFEQASQTSGFAYEPVRLTAEEQAGFYHGFSNEIIWPLFHDLVTACNFDPTYWRIYEGVNRKFTDTIKRVCRPGDMIWVHDYHLMEVARYLREDDFGAKVGFFLHIPFPPLEIFLKLPWRFEILRSLLQFDSLGFQTIRDRRNFMQCVRTLYDVSTHGNGSVIKLRLGEQTAVPAGAAYPSEREISVGSFPIGIDFDHIHELAESEDVRVQACWLKQNLQGRKMILGVDRLDYTKGLPNKMEAFANALQRYPDLQGKVTLVQHVVPSRLDIPEYHKLRRDLEQLISAINGEYTQAGWVPIHYMFHSISIDTLVAYYQAADIALITPLKDGMNLVAKEYCAARNDEDGVLILSEFAGSAAQMQKSALLVNPYNVENVADRLYEAFVMAPEERSERMQRLRRGVRSHDVFHWADTFLSTLTTDNLSHFPMVGDYIPREAPRER